ERDALADERDAPLPAARGRVREVDELRRLRAPGRHSEERAHPHPAAFGAVVDLDREPALLGELHGGAGEIARAQLVRRGVDEVARVRGGPREHLAPAGALLDLAPVASLRVDDPELLDGALGLLLLVAVEGVRPEERALDEGLRALGGGQPVTQDLRRDGAGAEVARAAQRRRGAATQHLERRLGARARRTMSRSPSVVSSSATRSTSIHCASAASLPGTRRVDSGNAR